MSAEIDAPRAARWSMAPLEYELADGSWFVCAEGVEVVGPTPEEAYRALRRAVATRRAER